MAEIDGKFRTLRDRHSRAIAGLLMGGYGALKIALRYHGNFAFAGSLSGVLISQLIAVAIAMGVRRLLWIVNMLYIGIVGWNMITITGMVLHAK